MCFPYRHVHTNVSALCLRSNRFQNISFEPSADPELLYAGTDRADCVLFIVFGTPDDDRPISHVDPYLVALVYGELTLPTATTAFPIPSISVREILHELRTLQAYESIVDGVPFEDVPERARNYDRDTRSFERGRSLLAG